MFQDLGAIDRWRVVNSTRSFHEEKMNIVIFKKNALQLQMKQLQCHHLHFRKSCQFIVTPKPQAFSSVFQALTQHSRDFIPKA